MKYLRIKKNNEFQKLFNRGKRAFSPCLTLLYFPSDALKMGVAVSKKHGKAHTRNRIKRLARAVFYENCSDLKKTYSIIILPKVAEEYSYKGFTRSIKTCFTKINECAES